MFSPYDERSKRNERGNTDTSEPVDLDRVDIVRSIDEAPPQTAEFPDYLRQPQNSIVTPYGTYNSRADVNPNAFFLDPNNSSIPYGSRDGIMFLTGSWLVTATIIGFFLLIMFLYVGSSLTPSARYGYRSSSGTDGGVIVLLAVVAFAGLIGLGVWQYFRDQQLLKEGIVLEGHATGVNTSWSKSTLNVHVDYTFRNPNGNLVYGRRSRARNDLREVGFWRNRVAHDQLPQSGTPVYVLYRNDGHYTLL